MFLIMLIDIHKCNKKRILNINIILYYGYSSIYDYLVLFTVFQISH